MSQKVLPISKIGYKLTEHIGLGERSKNCDLITKDLAGGPGNASCGSIDPAKNGKSITASVGLV